MKLSVKSRDCERKSQSTKVRLDGDIPAILYGKGTDNVPLTINGVDFATALRSIEKGHLPTTRFTLTSEDGKETSAIVKDVQYHRTTYKVLHLDFEELRDDVAVNVNVPIVVNGQVDCEGIKLGGVLRNVIRRLRVNCLPKDLPDFFELDVRDLAIKGTRRLSDIKLPAGVKPLKDLNEVAIVIAKR